MKVILKIYLILLYYNIKLFHYFIYSKEIDITFFNTLFIDKEYIIKEIKEYNNIELNELNSSSLSPDFILFERGKSYHENKNYTKAVEYIQNAIELYPKPEYLTELLILYRQMGNLKSAQEIFHQAIDLYPLILKESLLINYHYACILSYDILSQTKNNDVNELFTIEKSIYYFKQAIKDDGNNIFAKTFIPMYHEIYNNALIDLAIALSNIGNLKESMYYLELATKKYPLSVHAWGNLANVYSSLDMHNEALKASEKSLEIEPNDARILHNHAKHLQAIGNEENAMIYWKKAILLNPLSVKSLCSLAIIEGGNGNTLISRQLFSNAINAAKEKLKISMNYIYLREARQEYASSLLQHATAILPRIYQSVEEINYVRKRYEEELDMILDEESNMGYITEPIFTIGCGSMGYYLIYQGYNDKQLRIKLAKIYQKYSPQLNYVSEYVKTMRQHRIISNYTSNNEIMKNNKDTIYIKRKLRVGFVSAFFFYHSVGLLMQGVIARLSREIFDIYIFRFPSQEDEITKNITNNVKKDFVLPKDILESQKIIGSYKLDILIFSEIGMDSYTYFLSLSQLALRSAVFWGHAITSGISTIDYFITSTRFEDKNVEKAQDKYIEKLYFMEDLTTYFYKPNVPNLFLSKKDFGFKSSNMYLVPQTLYKIHPDFDLLLKKILESDIDGYIVFPIGSNENLGSILLERLGNSLGNQSDRIFFAPKMNRAQFLSLCSIADVVLDPFPVGGGRSSFEIFSVNTPIVMLYSRTSILQLTNAMYTKMGIYDCIAYTQKEFIDISLEIANSKSRRQILSDRINNKKHLIYESREVITEWERFLVKVTQDLPPSLMNNTNKNITDSKNDGSLIYFGVNLRNDNTEEVHSYNVYSDIDDPVKHARELCNKFDSPFEPIRYYFIEKIFKNGLFRYTQAVIGSWNIKMASVVNGNDKIKNTIYPVEIRYGDDIYLQVQWSLKLKYNLDHITSENIMEVTKTIEKSIYPEASSTEWINIRNLYVNSRASTIDEKVIEKLNITLPINKCMMTLVITTCKRLHLFVKTLTSLKHVINEEEWGRLLCEVIIIDDQSSTKDKAKMIELFPTFTFLFKSVSRKGHANSLNYIFKMVKTRFVFYLEDDWEFQTSDVSSKFLENGLYLLSAFNGNNNKNGELIGQLLLNNQYSGWYREKEILMNGTNISIPYYFHEFALLDPRHTFNYWPGFSLNPGIWDLSILKMNNLTFDEADILFERRFSIEYWKLGYHVAYLPYISCKHIGAPPGSNGSAYVLNGNPRPFD